MPDAKKHLKTFCS